MLKLCLEQAITEWWYLFVNGFCTSAILPGVLIFLFLLLGNSVGRGLGLPLLMWVGALGGRAAGRRQLAIGLGVGVLVWQIALAGYMAEEFYTNYTIDRPPFCEVRSPGEWGLDHDPFPGQVAFPGRFRYLPTDLGAFGTYFVIILLSLLATVVAVALVTILVQMALDWSGSPFRKHWKPFETTRDIPRPHYSPWLPAGCLLGLGIMSGIWLAATSKGLVGRQFVTFGEFLVDTTGGWGKQSGRQACLARIIAARKNGPLKGPADASPGQLQTLKQKLTEKPFQEELAKKYADARGDMLDWLSPYYPLFALFVLTFLGVLIYTLGLAALPSERTRLISPAGWILFFLHLAAFASASLAYFIPISNQFVLICIVGMFILAGRTYKLHFPNLGPRDAGTPTALRDRPVDLAEAYQQMAARDAVLAQAPVPPPGDAEPIRTDAISYALRDSEHAIVRKFPIALVCVSGGGSRSALWTMSVLRALETAFANDMGPNNQSIALPYHIRLMTGASGGMLGAAAYAANLNGPVGSRGQDGWPAESVRRQLDLGQLIEGTKQNFLEPVAGRLGARDMWWALLPFRLASDRGWAIEEAWRSAFGRRFERESVLDRSFDDLREGEKEGWRPSLIFSPMLVEDGRQLFITNLSLRSVTRNLTWTIDGGAPDDVDGRNLLSREGVEFFELFPGARSTFQVGTAARMSGSFPYVLPAAVLPTNPPRRVVDAGYYDNYGVGIAASWLASHLDWVRNETSGVVLIQIRDGDSERSRRREQVDDSFPSLISRGLQWATSPPEALWQSRVASNVYRNDNLIHLVTEFLRARGFPDRFFTTATFEFDRGEDVSLSWTLTDDEFGWINEGIGAIDGRVQDLVRWWQGRLNLP